MGGARLGRAALISFAVLLTLGLSLHSGGFFPGETALAVLLALGALLLRVMLSDAPLAGLGLGGVVGITALALLAAWTLTSAAWSDAPARAMVEFQRALLYVVVFSLFALFPGGRENARWLLRGLALALSIAVVAGLAGRLQPELVTAAAAHGDGRLAWPLGYWNALGLAGAMAGLLCLHLSSDLREHPVVRMAAAAAVPALAVAVYLTLSRGAIAAGAVGLAVMLILGVSRGMLPAIAAIAPWTAIALVEAYAATELIADAPDVALVGAQRDAVAATVTGMCALAAVSRAALLLADSRLRALRLWEPWPLRRKLMLATALTAAAVTAGVAAGGDDVLLRQWDRFLHTGGLVAQGDERSRLTEASANGRIEHWQVAVAAWNDQPLRGHGAGTYEQHWAQQRPFAQAVQDAHSLYLEVLAELGVVGLVLLGAGLMAPVAALLRRRGEDRVLWTAVLAVTVVWLLRAGIDWDWEMPALTLPVFALLGAACAREASPRRSGTSRGTVRLLTGLGILLLAVTPVRLGLSQWHLEESLAAFRAGDCPTAIDRALTATEVLSSRPQPFELIGYCNARLGRPELAVRMLQAAQRRDPGAWELHYGLAIVQAAAGQDPRPELRRARALNPLSPVVDDALERMRPSSEEVWRRESTRARLIMPEGAGAGVQSGPAGAPAAEDGESQQ